MKWGEKLGVFSSVFFGILALLVAIIIFALSFYVLQGNIDRNTQEQKDRDEEGAQIAAFCCGGGALLMAIISFWGSWQRMDIDERRYLQTVEEDLGKGTWKSASFPLIINCRYCHRKIKVPAPGKFKCPNCHGIDEIGSSGLFKIRITAKFPLTIRCRHCRKRARVRREGKFRCPNCLEIDQLDKYGLFTAVANKEEEENKEEKLVDASALKIFPLIVNCRYCHNKIKVPTHGKFRCHLCQEIDQLDSSGRFAGDNGKERSEEKTDDTLYPAQFPLVTLCRHCEKKMRVKEPGKFRCPSCLEIDTMDRYGEFTDPDDGDGDLGAARRLPPDPEAEEIVRGIGNYISREGPDLWGEIIQEPEETEEKQIRVAPGKEALEQLERILEVVWEDGALTADEYRILHTLRELNQIDLENYRSLEKEVRARVAKPCPVCESPLQYHKDY